MSRHIRYTILSSNLPYYFGIKESNNVVAGRVQMFDGDASKPNWTTPSGSLGNFMEDAPPISIQLNADLGLGGTKMNYHVMSSFNPESGVLPFGLKLDCETGEITGTLKEVPFMRETIVTFRQIDAPTWNTLSGSVGTVNEYNSFTTTLQATLSPTSTATEISYSLKDSQLPCGFNLDPDTGELSGTALDSKFTPNEPVQFLWKGTEPRWNTLSGMVYKAVEFEDVSIQLSASAQVASPIEYYLINGTTLPFNLSLDSETGIISGNTGEERGLSDVTDGSDVFSPLINTNDIGDITIGQPFTYQILATPQGGRSLDSYAVYGFNNNLPNGLKLDSSTGIISGTPTTYNALGAGNFYLRVIDSTNKFTTKTITFNILGA